MSVGNPTKVEPRNLDIIEAEGLGPALNAVGAVLRGEGLEKYGPKNWKRVGAQEHLIKCYGHITQSGIDVGGSEQPHTANAVARLLMVLQLELENGA